MRTRRTNAIVRMTAWVAMFSTGGLALSAPFAQARQIGERREMMKPKPINELGPGLTQSLTPEQWAKVDAQRAKERAKKEASKPAVRVLSDKEMARLRGRGPLRNKYLLGTLPWQRSLRDANLCTGNLFKSFTDIQVSPAKGAGLALQRTYNSNDDRPGPFGVGWTHAYDIRMEEAQGDPVKDFDADPSKTYADTNFSNRADFFGHKHRYHRDADGLYTPPAYLFDELDSNYGKFLAGDTITQASVNSDDQHSMDGTVKHFDLMGNARVCTSITDRYNNATTLAYDTTHSVGSVTIPLLQTVTDPSGRTLKFHWHNFGANANTGEGQAWRIVQVDGPQYSVVYDYYTDSTNDPHAANNLYNLKSVTLDASAPTSTGEATMVVGGATPRTTQFGYTSASDGTNTEYGLLASITDPQGLAANEPSGGHTVSYTYQATNTYSNNIPMPTGSVWVKTITEAAGYDSASGTVKTQTWYIAPYLTDHVYSDGTSLCVMFSNIEPIHDDSRNFTHFLGGTLYVDSQLRELGMGPAVLFHVAGAIDIFYAPVYDSANNVTRMSDDGGPYFVNGNVQQRKFDYFTYGSHGNQLTHWVNNDASSDTQSTAHKDLTTYYDASGYFQKKSVTDANGHTTTFIVGDDKGVDPLPTSDLAHIATSAGNKGSVLHVQDADYSVSGTPSNQKQFSYQYDSAGRKISETDLRNVTTVYTYGGPTDATNSVGTPIGNLTQVTRDYDAAGTRLNLKTKMTYDVVGHVTESFDPNGNKSDFFYNNLGQPTEADFYLAAGNNQPPTLQETIKYHYAANGRTEWVQDGRGTTTMTYEQGGDRVTSVFDPTTNVTTTYQYETTGERTTMQLTGQGQWKYNYLSDFSDSETLSVIGLNGGRIFPKDDPNSLTRVLCSINMNDVGGSRSQRVDYTTDSFGHLQAAEFNQAYTTGSNPQLASYCLTSYQYDRLDASNQVLTHWWLKSIKNTFNTLNTNTQQWNPPTTLVSNTYSYYFPNGGPLDYAGNRHANRLQSDAQGSLSATDRTETYGYDDLYRLTGVNYGDGQTQGYAFDAMGNRASKTDSSTGSESYNYDNLNRLTNRTVGTSSQNYTFDKDGNTLTDGVRTNVWDAQNRLSQCTYNGTATHFTYGADGLRRQKSTVASGVTTVTQSVLDNGMLVKERTQSGTNAATSATYMVGLRGPECRRDDTTGVMRWYLYDGLGSVLGEVAPSGAVVSSRSLDVYGKERSASVSAGEKPSKQAFVGSLGHTTDAETGGLVYMRARYMDTSTGRFISQDPACDGSNWFVYCSNDPINRLDQTGEKTTMSYITRDALTIGAALSAASFSAAARGNLLLTVNLAARAMVAYSIALTGAQTSQEIAVMMTLFSTLMTGPGGTDIVGFLDQAVTSAKMSNALPCNVAVMASFAYGLFVLAAVVSSNEIDW